MNGTHQGPWVQVSLIVSLPPVVALTVVAVACSELQTLGGCWLEASFGVYSNPGVDRI